MPTSYATQLTRHDCACRYITLVQKKAQITRWQLATIWLGYFVQLTWAARSNIQQCHGPFSPWACDPFANLKPTMCLRTSLPLDYSASVDGCSVGVPPTGVSCAMRCWACVAEKLLFHVYRFCFSQLKSTFEVCWAMSKSGPRKSYRGNHWARLQDNSL